MTGFKKFSSRLGGCACLLAALFFACEKTPEYCSDGNRFDPETQFCHDGKAHDKCGGGEYNPANQVCENGALKTRCGSGSFNPATEFCHSGTVHPKCGGNEFNPNNQRCNGGTVQNQCADGSFPEPGLNCDGTPTVTYSLTLNQNPTTGGSVTGAGSYQAGQTVSITATPANNYTFSNWTGGTVADANSATTTVTINENTTLTANFQQQLQGTTYTFTVSATPTAGGTVTRNPDQTRYNAGTEVTVTATPNEGYRFVRWAGASTSTDREVTFTLNSNLTLTAEFSPAYRLTLTVNPAEGGTTFVNNTESTTGNWTVNAGAQVTVRAQAAQFYTFTGWSGSVTSANATLTVNMNSDLALTANFTGGQFNPDVTYSSFTDERDGKSYRTVEIGGKVWMAQNLNYENHVLGNSICYNNNASNCAAYGRLYNWDAATTACPDGWHLPTRQEWTDLVQTVGTNPGTKLKSRGGWSSSSSNGTDDFGFSALPGGRRTDSGNQGANIGTSGNWWSATRGSSNIYAAYLNIGTGTGASVTEFYVSYGYSVRCVQD